MTLPPWWAQSGVRPSFSRDVLGYACALLLSWIAAMVTMHLPALHGTPLALNMASIVAITLIFSFRQGIVAVVATAFIFYFRFLLPGSSSYLAFGAIGRTAVILGIGWLIAWLAERYRMIGVRLRAALQSLREHADTLAQAQQGSHSAAWVFNIDDRTLRWAHGGAELLGRPFAEVPTFDALVALIHPDDRASLRATARQAQATGEAFHAEFRLALPDGPTRWIEARGRASERDHLWRGVVLDVTNRKGAELALLRSEKLAAIGRLSATVAHEINNPLEAVTNLLYLASTDVTLTPETRSYLNAAEQELQRLATIARHTLTFARVRPATGPTDVVALIESVVTMFQTRCNSRGGTVRFASNLQLHVEIPADDLRQVLTNLLSNACDALTGADGLVELDLSATAKSFSISVRDTGAGIAPENLHRVFDPFFTTKDDCGTGIGLWVSRELVEKNHGDMAVFSGDQPAPFQTCFRIEFPL